jgi:predicted phosphoribosyltransferase
VYLDEFMISSLKVSADYIEKQKKEQREEIRHRIALYRRHSSSSDSMSGQPKPNEKEEDDYSITAGKTTVLLIDDGIATGATVIAAAQDFFSLC